MLEREADLKYADPKRRHSPLPPPPAGAPEVFLVHPGGPFWAKKDDGAWSIPKGVYEPDEAPDAAARREFEEETGVAIDAPLIPLGEFRQPGGKIITAFAAEGDIDPATVTEQYVRHGMAAEIRPQPPSSPRSTAAAGSIPSTAAMKIVKGQRPILDALYARLGA